MTAKIWITSLTLAGVEESEVFEFSDYLWAALMKSTEVKVINCVYMCVYGFLATT